MDVCGTDVVEAAVVFYSVASGELVVAEARMTGSTAAAIERAEQGSFPTLVVDGRAVLAAAA